MYWFYSNEMKTRRNITGSYYDIGPISGDVSKGIEGESGPLVKKVDILSIPL